MFQQFRILTGRPQEDSQRMFLPILFLSICIFAITVSRNNAQPRPVDLTIEYLVNPVGLDEPNPRFSWIYNEESRGARQSAYRIIVAANRDDVENARGSQWDTGKIDSPETVNIAYDGADLKSGRRYYWRVRVWNREGRPGEWSEIHTFRMGLLDKKDWTARWITTPDSTVSSPLFRDKFRADKEIAEAWVHVTGVGYYELYINGDKVGDHVLDPALTDFRKRVLYSTYDVTGRLRNGENAWGLWVGNGAARLKQEKGRWSWHGMDNRYWKPMALLQLHIRYRDGTEQVIASDSSWKTDSSAIRYNNVYGGEDYDARLEQPGWSRIGFDDAGWQPVEPVEDPELLLDSQVMPPIRVTQTINPVNRIETDSGTYLFDLGQNIPGWWRIRIQGKRGTEIKIRGAETLNDSLFPRPLQPGDRLSTDKAYHRDVWTSYILKGGEPEIYEPRFFYTGYRYLEVKTENPSDIDMLDVEGRVVHSDLERNGRFTSSDSLLNRIYRAAIWSQRGNLHGYPTDCPHREKGGYNGDGQVIAETSMHDFRMHAFYAKWLNDMRDAQQENGRIPNTSPTLIGGTGGGIAWGSAYILLPWWIYRYYEDERLLQRHYTGMKRYLAYLRHLASNDEGADEKYIINEFGGHWDSLGEWEAPVRERNGPVNPLTNTYYWYLDAVTMARIADILGREKDRERYLVLADSIKSAFNRKFYDPDSHLYGTEEPYQSYLLFALSGDLVPEGHRAAVLDRLIDDIMVNMNGHLGTGILGTKHLFPVLADEGREEVLHRVVTQKTFPGWGYWIENGATTLWENWRGENSHNHQMFGSVNEYFYKYLAGIRAPTDPGTPAGYAQVRIKPFIPSDLDRAAASVETVRGRITSEWEKSGDGYRLAVIVPANSRGLVSLPDLGHEKLEVAENGVKIWPEGEVKGITGSARQNGYVSFDVAAGRYLFTVSPAD